MCSNSQPVARRFSVTDQTYGETEHDKSIQDLLELTDWCDDELNIMADLTVGQFAEFGSIKIERTK